MSLIIDDDGRASFSPPGEGLQTVALSRELRNAFADHNASAAWMHAPSRHLDDRAPLTALRNGESAAVRARLRRHLEDDRLSGIAERKTQRGVKELR